ARRRHDPRGLRSSAAAAVARLLIDHGQASQEEVGDRQPELQVLVVGRAPALEEEGARVELQELGENDASVLPQALADRLDVELPFIEKAIGDLEVVEILLLVGGDLVRREELRLDQQVGQATRRVPSAPRDETEGGVLDEDLRDRVVMDEGQN